VATNQPMYRNYPPSLGNEVSQGQHYMMINSYESLNAITSGATLISSVGLYIPAGSLKTSFKGDYTPKEGGATTARLSGGEIAAAGVDGIVQKATALLDKTGFMSAGGKSPNNYMALVYKGPSEFRSHSFAFKFFPKTSTESDTVQDILSIFKKGTLPRMLTFTNKSSQSLRAAYFKSPRHHEIIFYKGGVGGTGGGTENPYLFKIGKSVITGMDINYDPQSMVGFHEDGAPVGIDLSLTFQEIELQVDKIKGSSAQDIADPIMQNQSIAAQAAASMALARARGAATTGGPPNRNMVVTKMGK
jgi:hypothetical protein